MGRIYQNLTKNLGENRLYSSIPSEKSCIVQAICLNMLRALRDMHLDEKPLEIDFLQFGICQSPLNTILQFLNLDRFGRVKLCPQSIIQNLRKNRTKNKRL